MTDALGADAEEGRERASRSDAQPAFAAGPAAIPPSTRRRPCASPRAELVAAVDAVDAKLRSLAAILSRVAGPPPEEPGEPETRDEASRNPSPRNPSPASLEPPPAALRSAFLPRQTSIASPELCFPPPVATRVDAGTDVGPSGGGSDGRRLPGRSGPAAGHRRRRRLRLRSASTDVVFSVATRRCARRWNGASRRAAAAHRGGAREPGGDGGSGTSGGIETFR